MTATSVTRPVILTICSLLVGTFAFSPFAFCQTVDENILTSGAAMELLSQDAGRWSGIRETYAGGDQSNPIGKSAVTVVNRIEANSWLYFQFAEKTGGVTSMSKGTLAFDAETGKFIRRWFENENAEIKRSEVSFDPVANKFTFSVMAPRSGPVPDDGESVDIKIEGGELTTAITAEVEIRDANSRVVRVFSKPTDNVAAARTLVSELVLTKVTSAAQSKASTGGGSSDSDTAKSTDDPAKNKPATKDSDPVVHTLLVKVYVASSTLQAGQEPELELTPDDGSVKRIDGNTFEFSGLKSGVEYSVTGKYKLTTGFKVETAGKTSYEFAKDAKTKITKTKILKLEGGN